MFQTPIALHAIGDYLKQQELGIKTEWFQTPIALHAIGDVLSLQGLGSYTVSNPYRITCYRG